MKQAYGPETAGSVMTEAVPTCQITTTRQEVLKTLTNNLWEDLHYIYVVDENKKLMGWVSIVELVKHGSSVKMLDLVRPVSSKIYPNEDQERAVFLAVKNNLDAVPVVDEQDRLLGAVIARSIIGILHEEHVEDALLSVGIRSGKGTSVLKLAQSRIFPVILTRAPWLIVGAIVGVGLGFVSSQFEDSLQRTIALAYFVPVVAYIADSVGTQSEAITIRALAMLHLSYATYLLREVVIGFFLGLILGSIGAIGAFIISQSLPIALVVGTALLIASTLATTLAAIIPIIFKIFGKDPALGSGPIATALQDVLSIVIYFLIAILFIS